MPLRSTTEENVWRGSHWHWSSSIRIAKYNVGIRNVIRVPWFRIQFFLEIGVHHKCSTTVFDVTCGTAFMVNNYSRFPIFTDLEGIVPSGYDSANTGKYRRRETPVTCIQMHSLSVDEDTNDPTHPSNTICFSPIHDDRIVPWNYHCAVSWQVQRVRDGQKKMQNMSLPLGDLSVQRSKAWPGLRCPGPREEIQARAPSTPRRKACQQAMVPVSRDSSLLFAELLTSCSQGHGRGRSRTRAFFREASRGGTLRSLV